MHGSADFFWPQTCLKARILDGMHGQYIPGFYGMQECPNLGDFDFILNGHRKIEAHQAFRIICLTFDHIVHKEGKKNTALQKIASVTVLIMF